MLEVLLWIVGIVGTIFIAGYIHHTIKIKTDPYYRHQVEQEVQDVALERMEAKLRRDVLSQKEPANKR